MVISRISRVTGISAVLLAAAYLSGCGSDDPVAPSGTNLPPIANAGLDKATNSTQVVTLTGSGTDTDGTIASFAWSQTAGSPTVTLAGANTATASFTAPAVPAPTALTFTLTMTDNSGATGTDSLIVTVNPVLTGVLTDAPVGGISFTASAGPSDTTVVTGVTSSTGEFTFDAGDTVTFTAGDIVIAELPAAETITPREIAADIVLDVEASGGTAPDVEDVVTNLFVFFQSLDTDDDPNTITFPPNLGTVDFSGLAEIDVSDPTTLFTGSPEEFAADLGAVFAEIVETIPALEEVIEVVNVDEALQHAAEQSQLLLSGTWRLRSSRPNGDPVDIALTFFPNNTYLKGGLENGNCDGQAGTDTDCNGAEFNTYDWNPLTGEFTSGAPTVNTDGDSGLENFDPGEGALQVQGLELRLFSLKAPDGGAMTAGQCAADAGVFEPYIDGTPSCVFTLTRTDNTPGSIVGSWVEVPALEIGQPTVYTFFSDGTYITVDATQDGPSDPDSAGMERGRWQLASDGTVTAASISQDTTGTAGLSNSAHRFFYRASDDKFVFDDDGEVEVNSRLPLLPRVAAEQLYGSWVVVSPFLGDEPLTTAPHERANLKVITFFKNGEFLFGTQYNNADCETGTPNERLNGNGIEYGQWSLNIVSGELIGAIPPETAAKAYADTNGFCGLHEQTGTVNDVFFAQLVTPDLITFLGVNPSAFPDGIPAEVLAYDSQDDIPAEQQNDVYIFFMQRLPEVNGSRIGAWWNAGIASSATGPVVAQDANLPVTVSFFDDGSYFLAHTGAERTRGIERGLFNVSNGNWVATTTGYSHAVDTTFDSGLTNHSGHPDDLPASDNSGIILEPTAESPDEFRLADSAEGPYLVLRKPAADFNAVPMLPQATIGIDGNVGDWADIRPVLTDVQGDQAGNTSTDLTALYVAVSGPSLAFRMVTAGPVAFPHTAGRDYSHYEVGVHFFRDSRCSDGGEFFILNNFTAANGQNFHRVDDYISSSSGGVNYPTTTAAALQSLESSFDLAHLPAGYTHFAFNPYIQSFLGGVATAHDGVQDLSDCYVLPAGSSP